MTDLQCGVSACAYWCSRLCSREAISVFGASARKKEETGCGSFYPRFDSGGKLANAGIAGPGCEIACDAENCIYLMQPSPAFTYWVGAGWTGAGLYKTPDAWFACVRAFARRQSGK